MEVGQVLIGPRWVAKEPGSECAKRRARLLASPAWVGAIPVTSDSTHHKLVLNTPLFEAIG